MTFIVALFLLFRPLFPIAEYVINYDYISKVLCVNKATPELQCNGKCHLMKELAKSSENEKPISDKRVVIKEVEVLFYQDLTSLSFASKLFTVSKKTKSYYSNLYDYLGLSSSFHPPAVIV